MELVSVVIPVYNEIENLEPLCAAVHAVFMGMLAYRYELLMVDDGSNDGSPERLAALTNSYPQLRPLLLESNRGQSAALFRGMQAAQGAYIVTMDGDMQNDPADIPEILALLQTHDCVCGYRVTRQDAFLRRISSRVANKVRNALLHDGVRDAGCGLKGFRAVCAPHFLPFNGMHRFVGVFMRAGGMRVTECPVRHHPRTRGVSKYGVHNRLWRSLYDLVGVAWLRRRYVG